MESKKSRLRFLKTSRDFAVLKENGKYFVVCNWLGISYRPNGFDHFRFGVSISRKIGPAVQRNLIRRRLKEILRHSDLLNGQCCDVHFIFRLQGIKQLSEIEFSEFKSFIEKGLSRLPKSAS